MKESKCTKIETTKPSPRNNHSCCSINDKMYVFGGISNTVYLNDLWVYDPSSNTWEEKNPSNKPSPRYIHSAVNLILLIQMTYGYMTQKIILGKKKHQLLNLNQILEADIQHR